MGVGVLNTGKAMIVNVRSCVLLTAIFFVLLTSSAFAMQVERHTFRSFTNLSPALSSININLSNGSGNDGLVLLALKWGVLFDDGLGISSIPSPDDNGDVVEIIGPPLFYPNPFKMSSGAQLGYRLSRSADIELRIFDMRANQILKTQYASGTYGGIAGYNRLVMNRSTLNGYDLSSGVYFFILSSDGRVIGKGKFVVVP